MAGNSWNNKPPAGFEDFDPSTGTYGTPSVTARPTPTPMRTPPGASLAAGSLDPKLNPLEWMNHPTTSAERTKVIEDFLAKVQKKVSPHLPSWFPNMPYGNVPEIMGAASQFALGNEGVGAQLAVPALVSAATSYLGSSKADPTTAAADTFLGSLAGVATGHALGLRKGGGVGEAAGLRAALGEDAEGTGKILADNLPDVVPSQVLKDPAGYLNYFQRKPEDIWSGMYQTARSLDQQAQSMVQRAQNMPAGPQAHWLAQAKIVQKKADEAMDKYLERAKPFMALKEFFGQMKNYQPLSGKGLAFDSGALQQFLGESKNVDKWLDAGITEDTINDIKRLIHGRPGAAASEIMQEADVAPTEFHAGGRAHMQHSGVPLAGVHVNLPTAAQLAGERQLRIDPNNLWKYLVQGLISRTLYGVDEPDYSQPDADNTFYPPQGSP